MVELRVFLYTLIKVMNMDYLEIMNFCGYDLEAADRMVEEITKDVEEGASTVVTRPHIAPSSLTVSPNALRY